MDKPVRKPPKRKDDRVILQFDYDCFYAQVLENKNPALKSRAVGVKQKNILATCNYNARRQGVQKLMLISEAQKLCPSLVLVDGEDLTPFRDMSKVLFNFFRSQSWNGRVERLGFDEVFMDVTDIVDYNLYCLNGNSMANSFFYLSKKDPEQGFACDLTSMAGCVVASHLAQYLRLKIETDFGYTSTCGIAMNKLLSKLVGSCNKPRNQTTLLALDEEDAVAFMDGHMTRKVPGLGFKTCMLLESHILGRDVEADSHSFESCVTVGEVRQHPTMSPSFLETLLGGPGAERGIGARVWGLLHGVDGTEVKEASDIPSQISIEDTYKGLETMAQITEELHKLSCSLIRRMRIDLVVPDDGAGVPGAQKWVARPKTLRLSIRSWPSRKAPESQSMNFSRISRSCPLPNLVFDLAADIDELAMRLVADALLPLLRRLQPEQGPHRWNLQLLNICVANMVAGAADDKTGAGRDIAVMFQRQDEVLRPWKAVEPVDKWQGTGSEFNATTDEDSGNDGTWDDAVHPLCLTCGHAVPHFAMAAHSRYHDLGE
ncbi:impB/mucB/samB family protein [Drechmeria coniospora]|uniref:ImpB/mucB/samB family protein n=1 Tax=Drechmeria coniospora TaxID=98403 RepID=A0A151GF60_DRECN|nr:impB/mucB/samB family protein [Drechmeria coniospora]KYK55728.1 impB/mucB/samB family protein [Drechmeria coniospora]